MTESIKKFLRDEEGAVAIEYALVAAGIAAIVLTFFASETGGFANLLKALFDKISTAAGITKAS